MEISIKSDWKYITEFLSSFFESAFRENYFQNYCMLNTNEKKPFDRILWERKRLQLTQINI